MVLLENENPEGKGSRVMRRIAGSKVSAFFATLPLLLSLEVGSVVAGGDECMKYMDKTRAEVGKVIEEYFDGVDTYFLTRREATNFESANGIAERCKIDVLTADIITQIATLRTLKEEGNKKHSRNLKLTKQLGENL